MRGTVSIPQQIATSAATAGIDPSIALEVAIRESNLNQGAIGTKGEVGIFQLMPGTAAQLGVDPTDLAENIAGGTTYLGQLYAQFNDDPVAMLAAYNAGPGTVQRLQAQYGANWFSYLPSSTQAYVQSILANANTQVATLSPSSAADAVSQIQSDVAASADGVVDVMDQVTAAPPSGLTGAIPWIAAAVLGYLLVSDLLEA